MLYLIDELMSQTPAKVISSKQHSQEDSFSNSIFENFNSGYLVALSVAKKTLKTHKYYFSTFTENAMKFLHRMQSNTLLLFYRSFGLLIKFSHMYFQQWATFYQENC